MSVDIRQGDCREVIPQLDQRFAMSFMDPPFGIGVPYDGYCDVGGDTLLRELIPQAMEACWAKTDGVMVCHGPDDLAVTYLREAERMGLKRLAWCLWHYRFGQCGRGSWINSHCHCLIFTTGRHRWNPDSVLVASDRATKYRDKRIHDHDRGGSRLPFTVWGIPSDGDFWGRVSGSSAERRKLHQNQLPETYMARLVNAYTNPGDWVLDAFSGSGTLPTVANALGRNCVAVEQSAAYCESIRERVDAGAVRVGPQAK